MKNVLVFPCGSEIGLEIYRSLSHSTHFALVGGSSVDDHGRYVYEDYVGDLPLVTDPDFGDKINVLVQQGKIDYIIPAHDDVVLKLAELAEAGKLDCAVITSPLKTCQITRSKDKTYKALQGSVPLPRLYQSAEDVSAHEFPVFLKPDVGQGSKGTCKASSPEDITFYTEKDPSLLILEYLPGKEYTVDCFTDRHGELRISLARVRQRISNGISVNSTTVSDPRFKQLAEKINQTLELRGAWFFQVKESKQQELVLMEVAPRIAGTMGLTRCKGFNLPLLSLFDALEYDLAIMENEYELTVDRALHGRYSSDLKYKHVYIDFDDLILMKDTIDPVTIAYIYQCHNKGIKVHLITRHKFDIAKTLKKYRLRESFDELIHLQKGEKKSQYITEKDAIFIDDSFAERKDVMEAHNIPVFDRHMIESLVDF